MNRKGITLIELLVVVAIIAILAVALGFSYQGWQGAYRIEKETKDLYSDLTTARGRAITTGRMHFARCISPWLSYTLYDDTGNGTIPLAFGDAILQTTGALPDTMLQGYPRTVRDTLTWGVATGLGRINFHSNGLIDTSAAGSTGPWTIYISSTSEPDYDCIIVSPTRINMGKWNVTTTTCDEK